VGGTVMLTVIVKDGKKTIFKKELNIYDDNTINALIDEIQKTMIIGQKFAKAKSEMNSEAVKQMVEGWK
jgi:hypothetical protein